MLARVTLRAVVKGPNQINLAWSSQGFPGYGYVVEIQSDRDPRFLAWTRLSPMPSATGEHVYQPPVAGVPVWVTEPQYRDLQDGTRAQFIAASLLPAAPYRFRVRCYCWNTFSEYGDYSNVVEATTAAFPMWRLDPAGDDTADGSVTPWKTLAHAASVLQPGQMLMVAAGTYTLDQTVGFPQVCPTGNKIVVMASPGAKVVMSGLGIRLSGAGLVLDGLSFQPGATGGPDYQVTVGGDRHALLNCETSGGYGGVHLVEAHAVLVYGCYLHDHNNTAQDGQGGFVLALERSSHNAIWSNHFTRGGHDTSLCKADSISNRWLNNVMDGGWGIGWEAIEGSTGNLLEGSVIYHVGQLLPGIYKPGIEISSASNTVRRNLVMLSASWAVEISALYGGDSCEDVLVYNNTLIGSNGVLFESMNDGGGLGDAAYDGVLFANNICANFVSMATDIYRSNVASLIAWNDFWGVAPLAPNVIWAHLTPGGYEYPKTVADANAIYAPPFYANVVVPPRFHDAASQDYHLHPYCLADLQAGPVDDLNWPVEATYTMGMFGLSESR